MCFGPQLVLSYSPPSSGPATKLPPWFSLSFASPSLETSTQNGAPCYPLQYSSMLPLGMATPTLFGIKHKLSISKAGHFFINFSSNSLINGQWCFLWGRGCQSQISTSHHKSLPELQRKTSSHFTFFKVIVNCEKANWKKDNYWPYLAVWPARWTVTSEEGCTLGWEGRSGYGKWCSQHSSCHH